MYTAQRKILIAVLLLAAALPSEGAPDPYGRLSYFDEIDDLINELENANFDTTATTAYPKAFIDNQTSTTSEATGRDQHLTLNKATGDADHSQQPAINSSTEPSAAVDYSRPSGPLKQKERHENPEVTEQGRQVNQAYTTEKAANLASREINGSAESPETTAYPTVSTELPQQQYTITKHVEKETAQPKQPSSESPAVPTTIYERPIGPGSSEEETSQNPKVTAQQEVIHIYTTEKTAHPASQAINDSAESPETTAYPTVSTELPEQQYTITKYVEKETAQPKQPTSKSPAVPVTLKKHPLGPGSSEEKSPDSPEVIEKYQEVNYVYTTTEAAFPELQENSSSTQSSETTDYIPVSESLKPYQTTKILEQAGNSQSITPANVTTEDLQEQDFYSTSEAAVRPIRTKCSCDIKKVWIDLVFVIDVSRAVSLQDFFAIGNLLTYYFRQMPISQEFGQHARVSIVFGAERAFTAARLSAFANSSEAVSAVKRIFQRRSMLPVGSGQRFDINAALTETRRTLDGESRRNKPVTVVLFSATEATCSHYYAYENSPQMRNADPCRMAAHLTEGNNVLITVALKFGGLKRFPRILLGDPCFSIVNDVNLPKNLLEKICDANCFCLRPFVQYREQHGCTRYAECIYMHGISLTYESAVRTCKEESATLVDIFDEDKEQFIAELHHNGQYAPYWIGLKKENGQRVWSTGVNLKNGHYTNWAKGQPREGRNCTIVEQPINGVAQWISQRCESSRSYFFSCQRPACDTDYYTDISEGDDVNGS
uniref:C-type lectin domain-containing protein n=1 Tax=Ascaris lumbricoides TaxID=6252 RepID=A0A0M3HP70_ASCLU